MKSPPSFPLYPRDWLADPQVSALSPAARGIWFDAICAMHQLGGCGKLCGKPVEILRILRCTEKELGETLAELKATGAADVTFRNGRVTLINRRMEREYKSREQSRLRQQRHRKGE